MSDPLPRHVIAWNRRYELVALVNKGLAGPALLEAAERVVPGINDDLLARTLKACEPTPTVKRESVTAEVQADGRLLADRWLDHTTPVKTALLGHASSATLSRDVTAEVVAAATHGWTLLSTFTVEPVAGMSCVYGIFQHQPAAAAKLATEENAETVPSSSDDDLQTKQADGPAARTRRRDKAKVKAAALACLPLIDGTDLDENQPEYGKAHLRHMVATIDAMNTSNPSVHLKAMRWLGWLQCAIVMGGGSTLEEMKDINATMKT